MTFLGAGVVVDLFLVDKPGRPAAIGAEPDFHIGRLLLTAVGCTWILHLCFVIPA